MDHKMLGGVCAGLSDYFDIDVSLVRLAFVGIAILSALFPMFIFYIIAWIVIPVETRPSPAEDKKE
jgi:phage shock protein C